MLENQFIQFSAEQNACPIALPIIKERLAEHNYKFFVNRVCDGYVYAYSGFTTTRLAQLSGNGTYRLASISSLPESIKEGDCFRFATKTKDEEYNDYASYSSFGYVGSRLMGTIRFDSTLRGDYNVVFHSDIGAFDENNVRVNINGAYQIKVYGREIASGNVVNNIISNASFEITEENIDSIQVFIDCGEGLDIRSVSLYEDTIQISGAKFNYQFSQAIKVVAETDEISTVTYSCDEDEFGIPFSQGEASLFLPIRTRYPQYKTNDEVYTKLNGENVVLYSEIVKEYELETEYLPQDWHDKIIIALSCDHFSLNGVSLYKSAEYSIDHEKYTEDALCNRIMRGTCKVVENFNQRNSN